MLNAKAATIVTSFHAHHYRLFRAMPAYVTSSSRADLHLFRKLAVDQLLQGWRSLHAAVHQEPCTIEFTVWGQHTRSQVL